jgi:hypothetical protein
MLDQSCEREEKAKERLVTLFAIDTAIGLVITWKYWHPTTAGADHLWDSSLARDTFTTPSHFIEAHLYISQRG